MDPASLILGAGIALVSAVVLKLTDQAGIMLVGKHRLKVSVSAEMDPDDDAA